MTFTAPSVAIATVDWSLVLPEDPSVRLAAFRLKFRNPEAAAGRSASALTGSPELFAHPRGRGHREFKLASLERGDHAGFFDGRAAQPSIRVNPPLQALENVRA
jgi:hypothetical protein